ncbi:MAG: hypothetical protein EOP04_24735 [Proteobacteria bacterium]|nr:MAG: hypothetical protein EOP04_24735 [Pseudomonadota bacterium]
MAGNCHPPYPSDKGDTTNTKIVVEVWTDPIKTHNTKNLVEWLRITHDEAKDLGLKRLVPQSLRDERDATKPIQGPREAKSTQRRKVIYDFIIANGMRSTREFVQVLQEHGVKSNPQTVNSDLDELGFADHPSRKKPGRKSSQQLELPS